MNENEIMRQLKNCDAEISNEYSKFRNNITEVGDAAVRAMDSHRLITTLIPAVAGLVLCLVFYASYHAIIGVLCLAVGLYFAYTQFQAAGTNRMKITQAKNTLDNANNNAQSLDA